MADSTVARVARSLAGPSHRGVAALGVVTAAVVLSHVVAPAVVPRFAVYARYATYLVVFSVWMAWFIDLLAVWLREDPHPAEGDVEDG